MKTDKTTVYDLFQVNRRYIVPLFQRGYVWTQERQWEPLWEDIVAEAAVLARYRSGTSKSLQKHFLGALVLNLTQTALKQVPVVEIIDGQQRLTTLQVLLCVIRDETASLDNAFMAADLARLTANPGPFQQPDEAFKVWPTSALQDHFHNVLELGSAEAIRDHYSQFHKFTYGKWRPPRPALVEAYLFFSEKMRLYLDDDPAELPIELEDLDASDRAELLVDALIRNIQLVTIELEQEDDAQVIFETLNARGEPLTPSDLVRNFVFLSATREGMDVAALYDRRWKLYEEDPPEQPFWKQVERQGRLRRPRLDLFLFHYITFKTGEELRISHLYQSFRDWWDERQPRDLDAELAELQRYAAIYRQLLEPNPATRFGRFAKRLRTLDTSTIHPLLLWLAGELGVDSPELAKVVTDIESYVVRRAVSGYDQKNYNRFFLEALGKLRKSGAPPTAAAVREELAASRAESSLWPDDATFQSAIVEEPLYRSFSPRRTLMLLEALDFASRGPFAEKIDIQSPLTVEHVLPQGAREEDWPPLVRDGESPGLAQARRERATQQLGNLTLLTQPLNSSVSNGPFSAKQPAITKQALLPMNTYFQGLDSWDENAIEERGRHLAELAIKVWPGPPPP